MAEERATIHLVPRFDYDPVAREDQRTCTRRGCELLAQYLEACQQDGSYHLLLPELDCLRAFLAAYGEHRELLLSLASDERVDAGGGCNQPNEMCVQGEAIIRNLLYGRLYQEHVLGIKPTVYLPVDGFGHCLQLPQLAAKAGFEAIVWSQDISGVPPLCHALAPDGTAVLQKREPGGYRPETFAQLLDTVVNGLEHQAQLGLRQDLRLLGRNMAPPVPWLTGRCRELTRRDPIVLVSTPQQYLSGVRPEAHLRSAVIPVLGRDCSWYHMGGLVTRAELKIANRLAENRLLNAEKWATLAALLGAAYPDAALDKGWRQVIFSQHHDAISGTVADLPFLDVLAGYREALTLAAQVEERSLAYIAGRVGTARGRRVPHGGSALVVFNPLGWPRTDACRTRVRLGKALASGFELTNAEGRAVPCQVVRKCTEGDEPWMEIAFIAREVPSLGYRTYHLRPTRRFPPEAEPAEFAEPALENEHLALRADPAVGGGLVSIHDKRTRSELLDPQRGPANEVIALAEAPDRDRASWELSTTGVAARTGERHAEVSVLRGPVFSQLVVTSQLPGGNVTQEVTLYEGLPRIDLRTIVAGYRAEHELLCLAFPLAIGGGAPTFEDRFAAVVRRPGRSRLDFRTLGGANLSNCGLGAAQNWVDVGPAPSVSIMSGARRVAAIPLGPCAVVTSRDLRERTAARALLKALLTRGIPCTHLLETDTPETDAASCAFRISLGAGNAYSRKLLEEVPEAATALAAAKGRQQWAGVVAADRDPSGASPGVPVLIADAARPEDAPLLAEMLARAVEAGDFQIPESCDFSGLSGPADDHGVALINRGSLAASLESDGTLVSLLFHTAAWSTHAWGQGELPHFLVPEHKSHVFEHSLLPHAGDWREGRVVQAGYEVNNPLVCCQTALEPGPLPTELSLFSHDAPNVVLTAVKPVGNPLAQHLTAQRSDPSQGILFRVYESEGRAAVLSPRFPSDPKEAWLADLLEREVGQVAISQPRWRRPAEFSVEAPPCSVTSLVVRLAPLLDRAGSMLRSGGPLEPAPAANAATSTHCRYWDHNLGAAPMGNQPVTLWLRGTLPVGQNTRFSLGISNDSRDREVSGSVELIAPAEWTLIPRQVPFRIPAASQAIYEVMVVVPPDASPCFLRAVVRDGEEVLQDILPIGEVLPLEASLTRTGDGFSVRLRNPNRDYVEGQVALITPLESWGPAVDTFALSHVGPLSHGFYLPAGEEEAFRFTAEGDISGLWAVGKVMWYGRVQYVQESPPG